MSDIQTEKLTGYPSIDKPWLKYYDKEFFNIPIPAMNIYSYLKMMTKDYLALTAISYFGREISYKELFEHIEEAAKVLVQFGVNASDRVMYLMPNIPETA
jgi:long-chain acyl-CoA synthetase